MTSGGLPGPHGIRPPSLFSKATQWHWQVPNSKGRALLLVYSDELTPESQASYRPSHRPTTARVTLSDSEANYRPRAGARALVSRAAGGVAGYNPGPGRPKFELPSASPTASAMFALPRGACAAGSAPWLPA